MGSMSRIFPYYFSGSVVKGFGRGGDELGCPTANVDESVVKALPEAIHEGVYYGLARIDDGQVENMVMSIGTNPQYENKNITMEIHLLATFSNSFYGKQIRGLIVGFLREMRKFDSKEALIAEIQKDIVFAKKKLETDQRKHIIQQYFEC